MNVVSSRRTIPVFESLEGRTLFAGTPLMVADAAFLGGLQLRIQGTAGADAITVARTPDGSLLLGNTGGWAQTLTGNYTSLRVDAAAGNDSIALDAGLTLDAVLYGGAGNDTLTGGAGDDHLYGGLGTNTLNGAAGDDVLVSVGGAANDRNTGGAGRDSFWADAGKKEAVTDLSIHEQATGSLHRVNAFLSAANKSVSKVTPKVQGPLVDFGKAAIGPNPAKRAKAAKVNPRDLLGQNLADPLVTTAGAQYAAFADRPLFDEAGPSPDDVSQGHVGDCYYLSVLSSIAEVNPTEIRESVVDLGDGTYCVQFTRGNSNVYVRVDHDLPVLPDTKSLAYAGLGGGGSMWVAVMEKAYTYFRKGAGTYQSLESGWMSEGYSALGIGSTSTYEASGATALLNMIKADLGAGKSVTFAVGDPAAGSNLVGYHAYAVDAVITNDHGIPTHLRLRNPWGVDGGAVTDGANDGYVTVTAQQAYASFLGYTAAYVSPR